MTKVHKEYNNKTWHSGKYHMETNLSSRYFSFIGPGIRVTIRLTHFTDCVVAFRFKSFHFQVNNYKR